MLYQKLLMGDRACHVDFGSVTSFDEHRHPEAEFVYVRSGTLRMTVDKTEYTLHAGELALVAPMAAHAYKNERDPSRSTLVIEVGPAFLGRNFEAFTRSLFTPPVKALDEHTEAGRQLRDLLEETASLADAVDSADVLMRDGCIFQICGCILREFAGESRGGGDLRAVAGIDKALSLIHDRYAEPLSIDMAAEATGYAKSSFCRIFHKVVGETFHGALNRRRVESACCYLAETAMPSSEIAPLVGFADAKSFCRVFKSYMGMSPGKYRASGR